MVMQRRVQLQRAFLQLQRQSHSFWHTNDVESYGANAVWNCQKLINLI